MKISVRDYYWSQQNLKLMLSRIPKKNRAKFQADLLKLIEIAKMDNYENFNFE